MLLFRFRVAAVLAFLAGGPWDCVFSFCALRLCRDRLLPRAPTCESSVVIRVSWRPLDPHGAGVPATAGGAVLASRSGTTLGRRWGGWLPGVASSVATGIGVRWTSGPGGRPTGVQLVERLARGRLLADPLGREKPPSDPPDVLVIGVSPAWAKAKLRLPCALSTSGCSCCAIS